MTWIHDDSNIPYDDEQRPEQSEGKRRVPSTVIGAVLLMIIGSGSAFVWRSYAGTPYPSFSLGSSSGAPIDAKAVGLAEFQAFQQQIAEQMQTSAQILAAQQADIKRLSDQVAAISAKMDAIQSSIVSVRAAPPAPLAAKKPTRPKPPAATGAAPLQLTH